MSYWRSLAAGLLLLIAWDTHAQELYVFSEPASNMPAKAVGLRITQEGSLKGQRMNRTMPELMLSFNSKLMVHAQGFLSDLDGNYRLEGGSLYAKYRFFSKDGAQQHLRAAAFGRISTSKRSVDTEDINLEGDNSGFQAGLIVTQLLHKLALSATLGYSDAFGKAENRIPERAGPEQMISYSLSSGYLVLPVKYKNYHQPNFNVYLELLGKTSPVTGRSFLDLAPALQVILNSRTRIDLGYRFQAAGGMADRYNRQMFLVRAEFNFFNVLK